MYWLHCPTCQKGTVFTGINTTKNCHCVRCGHVFPRPMPNMEEWTKEEKAIWSILFDLEVYDIPVTIHKVYENLPADNFSTIDDVRAFFKKIDRIGE